MLMEDLGSKQKPIPKSDSNISGDHHDLTDALKKPKKVLEAGKAVLQDQSRGFRIIVIGAFVFSMVITVALVLSIYLGPPQIGANAAVATDVQECSDIGLQMLEKGGNAVDAAVAAMFCLGVVNAEGSGLGGGGFMLVHDHKVEKSEVFDFRETAPAMLKSSMFQGQRDKLEKGSLSVGVPGELKGMEAAHQKYGKLNWKTVVSPAADLARNGFRMTGHTEFVLNNEKFDLDTFMKSNLAQFYTQDDQLLKENDVIRRPDLAAALDLIADNGANALYEGSLGDDIVEQLANQETPGVLTKEDLKNYKVEMRKVVKTTYNAYTIESVPAPGSGPVLLSIMNILEGYKMKQDNVSYHRMLEAFKFGYAKKELLGDPKFNQNAIDNATNIMISKEESVRLRNLTKASPQAAEYYGKIVGLPTDKGTSHVSVIDTAELIVSVTTRHKIVGLPTDKGTSHVSVIDAAELIVSVTTTVNTWFGSMLLTKSGILLNNQLGDFNLPNDSPNIMNEVQPGKRPLSSMTPTVVYETGHLCGLRMVCGAANGTRIITGVAETLLNNLTFGMSLGQSIEAPRLHNQLYNPDPEVVEAEDGFNEKILQDLAKMGHVIQKVDKELSDVNGVLKIKDDITAMSDNRKKGAGAALFN